MKRTLLLVALAGCGGTYPFAEGDAALTKDAGDQVVDAGHVPVYYTGCVDPPPYPCGCITNCPPTCYEPGIGCCAPVVWACCDAYLAAHPGDVCVMPCRPDDAGLGPDGGRC